MNEAVMKEALKAYTKKAQEIYKRNGAL